uniref:Uncharacterized protein n=1 Tax=viral metagenome TaxID=1070528 RepID=A0A6M3L8X2_9ZZZZ
MPPPPVCCPKCGARKFEGVPDSALTFWERLMGTSGFHWVDTTIVAPSPDDLNYENEKYWEMIERDHGRKTMELRKARASNRIKLGSRFKDLHSPKEAL